MVKMKKVKLLLVLVYQAVLRSDEQHCVCYGGGLGLIAMQHSGWCLCIQLFPPQISNLVSDGSIG